MCTAAQWDRGVFAAVYYLPLLASFPNRSSFGALLQNYQSASARPQITILMSALLVAILSGLWLFCGWNCPQPPCPLTTRSYHLHLGSQLENDFLARESEVLQSLCSSVGLTFQTNTVRYVCVWIPFENDLYFLFPSMIIVMRGCGCSGQGEIANPQP